jgi:prevent-host-death family protein
LKRALLSKIKDALSSYLRIAEREEIIITRQGKPAGVLIGFKSDEDWFEYRLENHPEFLGRIASARSAMRRGRGKKLEQIED